jgi:hypothetical protein
MKNSTNKQSRTLASIIEQSQGKFFSCQFVKLNGEVRQMTARLGVKKYLKGGKSNVDSSKYITVFEPSSGSYKNINRDSIMSVKFKGIKAAVV